jgi:hypothetical protein
MNMMPRPRHDLSCLIGDVQGENSKATIIPLPQFGNGLNRLQDRAIAGAQSDGWSRRLIGRLQAKHIAWERSPFDLIPW